jgi:hypothetical protein
MGAEGPVDKPSSPPAPDSPKSDHEASAIADEGGGAPPDVVEIRPEPLTVDRSRDAALRWAISGLAEERAVLVSQGDKESVAKLDELTALLLNARPPASDESMNAALGVTIGELAESREILISQGDKERVAALDEQIASLNKTMTLVAFDHYEPASDRPAVGDAPTVETLVQGGGIGDCYLVATANALSHADPQRWKEIIVDHGESATVRLFVEDKNAFVFSGEWRQVEVTKSYPADATNNPIGAEAMDGSALGALLEKAYCQVFCSNELAKLDGGFPHEVLQALTGQEGHWSPPKDLGQNLFGQLVDSKRPVCVGSYAQDDLDPNTQAERMNKNSPAWGLPDRHVYTVTSIDSEGLIHLRNPWQEDHAVLDWNTFQRHFSYIGWAG